MIECLNKLNIQFDISTIGNESLITRGRNYFVSLLLANNQYTHLLFIDADITFNPISIVRMIHANKDIVAGAYPKKGLNWDKVIPLVQQNQHAHLQQISCEYAVNFKSIDELNVENGFIPIDYAGTGFMLIQRHVLETMVKHHPELKYTNDVLGYDHPKNRDFFYSLFDCLIDPTSKRYLSEDYAFCKRWLNLGGEIWLDLTCQLSHMGSYDFKGDVLKHLEFKHLMNPVAKSSFETV